MAEIAGLSFREWRWLWLLAALPPAVMFLVARERLRRSLAERFASERLRGVSNPVRTLRPALLAIALLFTVTAIAGPRFGFQLVPIEQSQANRIVLLDLSDSMGAEDIGTARLSAAKAIAQRIIASHNGKVALVVYEGVAQTISPLTTDQEAVTTLLQSLGPGELSQPGSDMSAGIREALKLTERAGGQNSDIILISDGENQGGGTEEAAGEAAKRHVRIVTVLVGTTQGGRIPLIGQPGFLRNENGDEVITRANPDVMSRIAQVTGGRFFSNPFDERSIEAIAELSPRGKGTSTHEVRLPTERFQWPLGAAFLFFLMASFAHRGAE
ncbi:MAG: VWA domain-containing protein [Acidobacteriota bacterium]